MKITKKTKLQIKNFLRKHNRFLISAHTSPEGDSLGAQLALARVIRSMGKKCDILNTDKPSREYEFMPGIANIKSRPGIKSYDAAIILDCSDISRVGNVRRFIDKNIPILNIDHHISNEFFGDINFVDVDASSACEVIYLLFKELNLEIDKPSALCLYTGIVTDTGSFRYKNTSAITHYVVSELLKLDIDAADVYRHIYQNLEISDLKLLDSVLSSIKQDPTGKFAWSQLTQEVTKKYKPKIDLTDNILSFLRSLRSVEVCALFRERSGKERNIRVNLRSKGKIDVNKIAQHFGGGGHKTASGLTIRNTNLKKAQRQVVEFIKTKL